VWPVPLAQVSPRPQLIFGIYLNFHRHKSLKNQYLPHSESKSYQLIPSNPAHQDLSNKTNNTFQFLRIIFQIRFNLIFSEEIIQYSRTFTPQVQMSWNQVHAPLPVESFPKTPRTWSEACWFSGSHNFKTKGNKVPS
jgi:hypothetical protein